MWGLPIKMISSVQGPMDMLCLDSPAKKAKKLNDYNKTARTKQHDKVAEIAHDEVNVTDQMFVLQYLRISLLMAATGKGVGGDQTGIRLLEMPENNQKNVIELRAITYLKDQTQKDWQELKKLVQSRTCCRTLNDNRKPCKKHTSNEMNVVLPPPKEHIRTAELGLIKQQLPVSDLNEKQIHATPIRNSTMSLTTLVLCFFYLSNMLLGS